MRAIITTCLTLMMMGPIGCATTNIQTSHFKLEPESKLAERYLTARQLESRGKLEPAREIYSDLLLKHPRNPDIQHRLAVVCTRLQRYGEAKSLYTRALEADPRNVSLLTDMGYFYYLRGDSVEAELMLKKAIHIRPDDLRATSNLALVIGRQGRMDESLKLLRQVHDEPAALSNLAYIHHLRGEEVLAKQRYREALSLDPQLSNAGVALAELTKLYPEITVADFIPPSEQVSEPATLPATKEIQQVKAVAESSKGIVSTAGFTRDAAEDEKSTPLSPQARPARSAIHFEEVSTAPAELDQEDSAAEPREIVWSSHDAAQDADDGLDWSVYEADATPQATSLKRRSTEWDADETQDSEVADEDADDAN